MVSTAPKTSRYQAIASTAGLTQMYGWMAAMVEVSVRIGHGAAPFGKVDDREVVGGWDEGGRDPGAEPGDEPRVRLHVGIDVGEDAEAVERIGGHRPTSS